MSVVMKAEYTQMHETDMVVVVLSKRAEHGLDKAFGVKALTKVFIYDLGNQPYPISGCM